MRRRANVSAAARSTGRPSARVARGRACRWWWSCRYCSRPRQHHRRAPPGTARRGAQPRPRAAASSAGHLGCTAASPAFGYHPRGARARRPGDGHGGAHIRPPSGSPRPLPSRRRRAAPPRMPRRRAIEPARVCAGPASGRLGRAPRPLLRRGGLGRRRGGLGLRRASSGQPAEVWRRRRPPRRGRLVEPQADDAGVPVVAHRHAVQRVGGAWIVPRLWVITMNWVVTARPRSGIGEAAHVRLVQRRVHLVQHAERDRPDLQHRQEEGHRGERALSTREHPQRLCSSCPAAAPRSRCQCWRGRWGPSLSLANPPPNSWSNLWSKAVSSWRNVRRTAPRSRRRARR